MKLGQSKVINCEICHTTVMICATIMTFMIILSTISQKIDTRSWLVVIRISKIINFQEVGRKCLRTLFKNLTEIIKNCTTTVYGAFT